MNYKKALGAGLLVFAIQFALVSVLSNLIGPFLGASQFANYIWQGVMVVLLIAIVYFVSRWYFIGNKASLQNGAYLGLILVVTSVAVTLIQAIPAMVLGRNTNGEVTAAIVDYLTGIPFLLTAAVTIGAAVGTAYLRQRTADCNVKDAIGSQMPEVNKEDCKDDTCETHKNN